MSEELWPTPAQLEPAVGLRHNGDRRHIDRRRVSRGTRERRRRDRRKAQLRSLVFSALAFAAPQHLMKSTAPFFASSKLAAPSGPRVTTNIDSFEAVEPESAYDELIQEAAEKFHVSATLIKSVMQTESNFDPSAVSRVGAMGLMQLMPNIAEAYGVQNPFDPRENIMAGAQILRELMTLHRGNLSLVLASYNAGAGVVARYGGAIPPFRETRNYVRRVSTLYRAAASNND